MSRSGTGGSTLPADVPAADPALAVGCASVLAGSAFAQRALRVELGAAAGGAAIADRLAELGRAAWTGERLTQEFAQALRQQQETRPGAGVAEALAAALRVTRRRLLLGLMVRDVAGLAPLAEVMQMMTALAELAVRQALSVHATELAARHGVPCDARGEPQDLLVVAMGKAGGGELNVSSDLDLVFVYAEEGSTAPGATAAGAALDNQTFFDRLGKRLIATLSEATADGFVFRVDMRLRPNGDAGPLVVSLAMLEEYLVRQGREWERFAWLKGRVIEAPVLAPAAAFRAQAAALATLVRPFVFRRYLDFGTLAALRELHDRIRAESGRRAAGRPERALDVKLGRGGIREIEFTAQTLQVVRGGREAALRVRPTLEALAALQRLGLMSAATAAELAQAYEFLRRLEHALQYVDDAQTHLIPAAPAPRAVVARLLRLAGEGALMQRYEAVRAQVAAAFDAVLRRAPGEMAGAEGMAVPTAADEARQRALLAGEAALLQRLGFDPPEPAQAQLAALAASPRLAAASEATRALAERLTVRALSTLSALAGEGAGGTGGADALLARWVRLLEVIARRSTYLALLTEYPQALERVLRLLAAGNWATEYLLRHPILLDELIDERHQELPALPAAWADWGRALARAALDPGASGDGDPERAMNLLRDAHHAQLFRLLMADLNGHLPVETLADHLSGLADAVLEAALACCWRPLAEAGAGPAAAPDFAVVAYGKLGGKELGYASDLDLIFLYEEPPLQVEVAAARRTGPPRVDAKVDDEADAATIYTRLARRLVAFLTTMTASGVLFDIDLRLRPNGNSGLLVSSFGAFERYQRNADGHGAWVWEHQALTRARWCAGSRALGERFEQLRREVLARPRQRTGLAAEVIAMRRRMLEGHPNRSGLFDLKHDRGGMVDIEFAVQFLVLAEAHAQPRLLDNLGNIALLRIGGELGLVEAALAAAAASAYRDYRRLQHALRLQGAGQARLPVALVEGPRASVLRLWQAVLGSAQPAPPAPAAAAG